MRLRLSAVLIASLASPIAAAEPFAVVAVLVDQEALAGAHDVELQGRHAYVCGKGGSLAVIDVADPTRPKIVWSRRDPRAMEDAETVLPAGDQLFVGTRDFLALDIRDPLRPQILHTLSDRPRIDRLNGLVRRGNLIFAANKEGTIDVFDVSNPVRPTLFGARNVAEPDGISKPHDVDWLGDLLVVVDPAGFGRRDVPGKVAVYRVFDAVGGMVLPPDQWTLVGTVASRQIVGGNRVRTKRNFAFVAASLSPDAVGRDQLTPCVAAIDLTIPEKPEIAGVVPFPDVRGPNGMCVAGDVVFVSGGQTVMAVDITEPRTPKLLASLRCTEAFHGNPGLDDGHDLAYRDGYLYLTGQTTHSFGILRIDDARIRAAASRRPK